MGKISLNSESAPIESIPWIKPNIFLQKLQQFYNDIQGQIPWSDSAPTFQSSIQTSALFPEDLLHSCDKKSIQENDYYQLPKIYQNSVITDFLKCLPFSTVRMRWMKLMPKSCYSVHTDSSLRLHVPIYTSPQAYFAFADGGFINLTEGGLYLVDTTKEHSFLNGSERERVHIVATVESKIFHI